VLKQSGISNERNKCYKIFIDEISSDFTTVPKMKSSEYVKYCWEKYLSYCAHSPQGNSMNGNIFELIIASEMYRQSLCPMFLQASVAFVPNVIFDILLFSSEQFPIGLSLKTSLRERYKQADLEAIALKYVHRKALNFLITLDSNEAKNVKIKVNKGELLGINDVIVAESNDFNNLITYLSKMKFINPGKIDIITTGNVITK